MIDNQFINLRGFIFLLQEDCLYPLFISFLKKGSNDFFFSNNKKFRCSSKSELYHTRAKILDRVDDRDDDGKRSVDCCVHVQ